MRRTLFLLFFTHLLTRLIYINLAGLFNNYGLQIDSLWLVNLADQSTQGNFNFDIGRFIASPVFPLICGLLKMIFHSEWSYYLILFQVTLSAISGLYIYKISALVFRNLKIALFSSLLFAFFPMTLWFVHTFSQESIFQSLLIITIYYLLSAGVSGKISDTIKASIFFSLTYLTKSHILLFSLFIPLIYFHHFRFTRKTLIHSALFALIALSFSVPYGLFNYRTNGTYVISSNGSGYQFFLGNSEAGYKTVVDVPDKTSMEFASLEDISVTAGYVTGEPLKYKLIMDQDQKFKQKEFFHEAIHWIGNNPLKFVKIKIYDAIFFLLPGVSFRHYKFSDWIMSFLVCSPIYILCYISIFKKCRSNFRQHSWIFYLFLSMFLFSTVWYVQNRFRTITLEPFYIVYASGYIYYALGKTKLGIKVINFLDLMFLKFLQNIRFKELIFGRHLKNS